MHNPYEPPSADLISADLISADLISADQQSSQLAIFPRFSTWYVFGLSIVTLNLYILYWFYDRSKILNRLNGVSPISDGYMIGTIVVNVIPFPLSFADLVVADAELMLLIGNAVNVVGTIPLRVWAFMFRHRLNDYLEAHQPLHATAGPVFTFLFQL